jgi:hypothetical protein
MDHSDQDDQKTHQENQCLKLLTLPEWAETTDRTAVRNNPNIKAPNEDAVHTARMEMAPYHFFIPAPGDYCL